MMIHQLSKSFSSSHGELAWDVTGSGPAVVLVHGTPASSIVWHGVVQRLKERYRLYYLDLPGFGASEKFTGQEVRLRTFARALSEFLEQQELHRAHLVGHDFGAATVFGAHLVEGSPAASLTIIDGVVLSPWGTPYSRLVNEHEAVFAALPDYIHRATLVAHLQTAVTRAMPAGFEAALLEPWTGEVGKAAYYRQVAQYDYPYTEQLEKLYPGVNVPTRILWGEQDQWVNCSNGQRLQDMIPGSELRLLPDAGHFAMLDCPGLVARELELFLSNLEQS